MFLAFLCLRQQAPSCFGISFGIILYASPAQPESKDSLTETSHLRILTFVWRPKQPRGHWISPFISCHLLVVSTQKETRVWVKIKPPRDRRFWSMFPLTRATHFGVSLFLTHSHMEACSSPQEADASALELAQSVPAAAQRAQVGQPHIPSRSLTHGIGGGG